jgi:hypothetical protein
MSPLPKIRLDNLSPFANVGVDYAGPLFCKHNCLKAIKPKQKTSRTIIQNECTHAEIGQTKVWLALFTCLRTRAIHIEVVENCSTLDFLEAFRRFVGHCGRPNTFYSDNATQFQAADKNFKEIFQKVSFQTIEEYKFGGDSAINWEFSTPYAHWTNGVTERMIKILKRQLRITLQNEIIDVKTLQTIVIELKRIINDRPLAMTTDPDSVQSITPNMLIFGRQLNELKTPEIDKLQEINFSDMWIKRKKLLNTFWNRWQKDYLEQLSVNRKWNKKEDINLNEGDIVLLKPETLSKNQWNIGKILKVMKNANGEISKVMIKPTNGSPILRTVRQIALLEPNFDLKVETNGGPTGIRFEGGSEKSDGALQSVGQHSVEYSPDQDYPPEEKERPKEVETTVNTPTVQVETGDQSVNDIQESETDGTKRKRKRIRHRPGFYKKLLQ